MKKPGVTIIVVVVVAFLMWSVARVRFAPTSYQDAKAVVTIDTVINHLTVHQFNREGRLIMALQTPLVHHYPDSNNHELFTPHITVAEDNQLPWNIDAKKATVLPSGKQVIFYKNVLIVQKQDAGSRVLKTEEMTYFPKENIAFSPLDVMFSQEGHVVYSHGMKANLAENNIQLLGHVKGQYEP